MLDEFINRFEQYIRDWKRLDRFRLNWWLRYPLYLPVGFFLEMRNLHRKQLLTEEYVAYMAEFKKRVKTNN